MEKKWWVIVSLVVLGATLSCTKKTSSESSSSVSGVGVSSGKKIFQYYRTASHKSLDPMKQFDAASAEIISNVYDTLIQYHYLKRPYTLIPGLLERMPEKQADNLTYLFTLKKNIKFHNDPAFPGGKGRQVTADDAIYSIKRFADANVNVKSFILMKGMIVGLDDFREKTKNLGAKTNYQFLEISGIRKKNLHQFEVKFVQASPLALYPFAASPMSIVPREAVIKYGGDFAKHPVGTGPFKVQKYSRRGKMILEKNAEYWDKYPDSGQPEDKAAGLLADAGKSLPLVDEIHLPLIEETQPAMLKFLKGEIDWIGIDKDNFSKMALRDKNGVFRLNDEYAKKYNMYSELGLYAGFFRFNMKDKILGGNKALRQAIAYALDTQAWLDLLRNSRGLPLQTIVPHPIAGSEKDLSIQYYVKNLEMAKKKLIEAGFPGGKGLAPITMEYRSATTETRQSFEFVRNEMAAIGIVLKANFQTFSAFLRKIEVGNYQMIDSAWGADFPDGENFYQLLYGPNKIPGPNTSNWQNDRYDELYLKSRFMKNGPERYKIFAQMSAIVKEEVPLILRFNILAFGMYQHRVLNMKKNMMIDSPFKYLNLK